MNFAQLILTTISICHSVYGHGYLKSPRSRNWDAAMNGKVNQAGVPPIDYCPHCLNQAKGRKICGFNQYNNYDDFRDSQGNPMPWVSVAEYKAGQIIDVTSYLDTHHNGHMEIRACPDGEASTLACFNRPGNALTFVEDVMWGMPADPSYPERGMYYGGQGGTVKDFHMRFKLPDHIVGNQVMLQWKYITANSCSPPGYAAYFARNNLPSSFWTSGLKICSPPYPSDGSRSEVWPEQFFNCASVSIIPSPSTPLISNAATHSSRSGDVPLFKTTATLSTWDAFLLLDSLTLKVSNNPPLYALQAAGGAAGSGNVVSESQAYGIFITAVVLASWDTHKTPSLTDADWNRAVTYFEGYFNGWKRMCLNSNKFSGCQGDGTWCKDSSTGQRGVCLPGWKHKNNLSAELGTGSAPDGDEDAIAGMIIAIKAFENKVKPSWYDDLRKWADASCTAFLNFNTVVDSTLQHRIVKLGSCWGGWESNGNNPSYHSPGNYKIMRDFHVAFPNSDRDYILPTFGSGTLQEKWDRLITTSYAAISALQCPEQGMVPNWAMLTVQNGKIQQYPGTFSGSGTPQWEYGAEAARLTWRVAIDAAMYPSELQSKAKPYLEPLLNRLRLGYNPNLSFNEKYFGVDTFTQCALPGTSNTIYAYSAGWKWNAFVFAPTISALVVPIKDLIPSVQQNMIDAAGRVLASNIPNDYYPRCWTIIGILTLNGAIQSAGTKLKSPTPPITPTMKPVAPVPTLKPVTPVTTLRPVTPVPTLKSTTRSPISVQPVPILKQPTPKPTSQITMSNGIPLPCCSWNRNYCEQQWNTWCHASSTRCMSNCNGQWITGAFFPTPSPTKSTGRGCCTWGGWSTCPSWTQNSQDTCQITESGCKKCSGTWILA